MAAAKASPQSSALSIETALKNVPELTVTMKPHHKGEVAKEKAAGGLGYLIQKLKAALANVAYQNNSDNKRYEVIPSESDLSQKYFNHSLALNYKLQRIDIKLFLLCCAVTLYLYFIKNSLVCRTAYAPTNFVSTLHSMKVMGAH